MIGETEIGTFNRLDEGLVGMDFDERREEWVAVVDVV